MPPYNQDKQKNLTTAHTLSEIPIKDDLSTILTLKTLSTIETIPSNVKSVTSNTLINITIWKQSIVHYQTRIHQYTRPLEIIPRHSETVYSAAVMYSIYWLERMTNWQRKLIRHRLLYSVASLFFWKYCFLTQPKIPGSVKKWKVPGKTL